MAFYALIDGNNFYCSCERIFKPSLQHRPLVILSNNDGCIISRSEEAKELGIRMGLPAFKLREIPGGQGVHVYSSNYTLYGDISARVYNSLSELLPVVEPYSIDENFADVSIFPAADLVPLGQHVRRTLLRWTKIPTCVGLAPTKTLAKLANKVAKKDLSLGGVLAITSEAERREILSRFPVEDVWGVGRQHRKRLAQGGVHTALELADKPDWWVKGTFGTVTAERMVRELRGEACLGMLETGATPKNICCSRSFGLNLASESHITEAVTTFAYRVGEKLREQGAVCRVLTVFLHTNAFRADLPQYGSSLAIPLPVATGDSAELVAYARAALLSLYKPHFLYKKAGVVVTGISPADGVTGGLFDAADRGRAQQVSAAMDAVNRKFGRGTVRLAVQGTDKAFWHPKVEKRTPRYTTQWKDLPKVELG